MCSRSSRFVSRLNCFLEVGVDGPDQDVAAELEPANEEAGVGDVGIEARPRFGGHRSGIGETDVLGLGVGIVLATRAGNEMVGVHAAPDVSAVAQDQAVGDQSVLHLPGDPVRVLRVPCPVLANEGAVTRLERPVPDVAAAQRVGFAVIGDPLSEGPGVLASGHRSAGISSVGTSFLVHVGNVTEAGRNHLLWSLERRA